MKFSFSTLACPDYTWADIYSMAKDLGFDGIEVRGLGNDIFDASKNMPFSPRLLPATKQKLRALRLTIPCLSSGCCLRDGATVETVAEVRAYIEAAESIGTPYVRVLGDLNPAPDGDVDDEAVLAALRALRVSAPIAIGDVLAEDVAGTGVALVATDDRAASAQAAAC